MHDLFNCKNTGYVNFRKIDVMNVSSQSFMQNTVKTLYSHKRLTPPFRNSLQGLSTLIIPPLRAILLFLNNTTLIWHGLLYLSVFPNILYSCFLLAKWHTRKLYSDDKSLIPWFNTKFVWTFRSLLLTKYAGAFINLHLENRRSTKKFTFLA